MKYRKLVYMSFEVLIDDIDRDQWAEYAGQFTDYNIYQTWAYQEVRADIDGHKISRAVVKDENDEVLAMSHVRIRRVESLGLRIGYIQMGPLFFRKAGMCGCSAEVLSALCKAYLGPKVNVLRIAPNIVDGSESEGFVEVLKKTGFQRLQNVPPYHTITLPLGCSSETLRKGMHQSWRRKLHKADNAGVEAVERLDEKPFEALEDFHQKLRETKDFKGVEPDIFARTQSALPNSERMSLVVTYFEGEPVTVHVTSNLGDTAIMLLAASNEKGYSCWSSYLAWWKAITISNDRGMKNYDVGGVDFENNLNVSRFKAGIGGQEKFHIGVFEAYTSSVIKNIFRTAEKVYRAVKKPND